KVTGLSSGTKYTFKVRAYRKDTAGKVVYGKCGVKEKTTLEFKAPTIKSVTQSGNTFTIKWSKVACDGYIVYSLAGWASGGFSKLTTITNSNTTSFTFDPNDSEYFTPWGCGFSDGLIFKVRAYILDSSGNKVFSKGAVSDTYYSLAYLRNTYSDGIKILKKATKSSANKSKVSDADKKILKEFADTYFQDGWSDMDKIVYTYIWLMHSLTYAETTEQWNKVVGLSYVDAAFNKKLGQCIQYNGALTAMINYLGYDASVVGGLSGWGYQHFWCEMTIDGVVYVLDAHLDILCEPYETSGYKKY
ncbi:MAG: transglutaminase-like domain-containing protein, partial [Ruminococcus sp.]|nr:transglutaminase-like domain-containing protein [Ruminococcus sp.]